MYAPCWSNQKQVILASTRGCFLVSIWWCAWAHPASSARDSVWFTSHANSERDLGQTVRLKDERTINSRNNISDKKRDHRHSHSCIKLISSEFSSCSVHYSFLKWFQWDRFCIQNSAYAVVLNFSSHRTDLFNLNVMLLVVKY